MTAEQEELLPKPRRGKTKTEEQIEQAARDAKATRAKLQNEGVFVDPIKAETYPGPIGEAPPHTEEELVTIETALEIFADQMSPAEKMRMENEIEALKAQPRGRVRLTLIEKISLVMEAIDAVEKKGRNEAQKYDYQRATDVTKEVRREFIKQGLVFVTSITDIETLPIPRDRGTPNMLVTIKGNFEISDGIEAIKFSGVGMGQDVGDKGVYKAITGMLKYGLRTLLLLPDEKDDPAVARQDEFPEATGAINISGANVSGVKQGGRQSSATAPQIKAIKDAARELMLSPESMSAFIVSELGSGPKLDPGDLPGEQVKQVMNYLETLSFEDCGKIAKGLTEAVDASGGR